ncbi:U2 snRNP complex subunit YSF3 KNAG_0I02320 [Huiozyma naganishii CBS 8797]|uniref:Splicing factor subunit n=1 Tax=Huiozyma naganishii (strain ATCC MYA-139 / BCRC 22969 / CBS 8797 / KCTC 17520 / NBRC 10181 / NCYC 3082 / Yp74L-3) TaxID=1071383 RepID=J7RQG8_HUIN7|nr:hypothetical protein KNAG_0I02320 [Kazachstania naganishii CBS 8797]CCK72018.1 hypothetical protein KNAG_0I02320 [Kazachstania naganishii CBS 8797]
MSDKQRQRILYNTLKQKYEGLGNENTTREEWLTQVVRDSCASIVLHSGLLEYQSLGPDSQSKHRERLRLLHKMADPEIKPQ